jgi:hypothetical protein
MARIDRPSPPGNGTTKATENDPAVTVVVTGQEKLSRQRLAEQSGDVTAGLAASECENLLGRSTRKVASMHHRLILQVTLPARRCQREFGRCYFGTP